MTTEGRPVTATFLAWASAVRAELFKTLTLRSWWVGVALIMALNIYFAHMGASLLAELSTTLRDGHFIAFDGQHTSYERAAMDTILASPYQSVALFLPLLVAATSGHEYRTHQVLTSAAAVPVRLRLVGAKVLSTVLWSSVVTLVAFTASDIVLLLFLPGPAIPIVLSMSGFLVGAKVVVYAVLMALFADALTHIFRSSLPALVCVVLLLVLALTGALEAIASGLGNVLPMIGAQTFLFGYPRNEMSLTGGQGVALLIGWAAVAVSVWAIIFRRRDLS